MQANTLYYTLSVIPQVIGAIAAIMATITFFRIASLREYLIGDGKAVLERWDEYRYLFPPHLDPDRRVQHGRMGDAVGRRSVPEIRSVLRHMQALERDRGHTKADRPHGLQYLYEDRFCGTERHIDQLKNLALVVLALSFLSIAVSITSLALVDAIMSPTCMGFKYLVVWVNVALFVVSLASAFYLMWVGLFKKTVHETDTRAPDGD